MFKCFFLPSIFFGFAVVNFGAFDFVDNTGGNMFQNLLDKNQKESIKKNEHKPLKTRLYDEKKKESMNKNIPEVAKSPLNEYIKNHDEDEKILVARPEDNFRQLVLYYYIAVSFLIYAYKKVDSRTISLSNLGDKKYVGPLDADVFAVYKEFSGSDSKGMSTYYDYLSHFCGDVLGKFLEWKDKISYSDAYEELYATIGDFLSQEEINIELEENGWQDEPKQWVFTVALQVFAYKKIYEYLNKNISSLEGNNQDAALQHDLVYVKFLSEMMYNIFKNVLESFSSDHGNIIRSRDLFFLSDLKPKNIGPKKPENMFYSTFSSLVFRPARLDGSVKNFLDCFYPIINRMKRNK